MTKAFAVIVMAAFLSGAAAGQSAKPQVAFELADVHLSPPVRNTTLSRVLKPVLKAGIQGEHYEVRNATMVDLIRTAYGVDAEQVVGGPPWLEFDRFDITALVRPNTPPETLRPMLQSLLADRFKLVTHRDSRPVAALVLSLD